MTNQNDTKKIERPPVIVIMGHVDHGKSALLDYIRKSNVVESEAGGITQHISAYEITHELEGIKKKITFIDTPGHAAFSAMRARGANVADIAVLVVSAEDGVKTQTLEALKSIESANIPFIIAINKIDLPGADIQKTKNTLIENEIYIEGMGGDISAIPISAKTGEGIDDLLETMLLTAEMEELKGDTTKRATGVVIESNRDDKRGITATIIIKDGTLNQGDYVVSGAGMTPVRLMEDFMGNKIESATFSSPVALTGFDALPSVGAVFTTYENKKNATLARSAYKSLETTKQDKLTYGDKFVMPLILKADTAGSLEAIMHELTKLESDLVTIRVLEKGIGTIGEADIKLAIAKKDSVVIGFNTTADSTATEAARQHGVTIKSFKIIYELAQWLDAHIANTRPKVEVERVVGEAKILAHFSSNKQGGKTIQTVGGSVQNGQIRNGNAVHIYTHDEKLKGEGTILTLQSGKESKDNINEGQEFGTQIQTEVTIEKGDKLKCIEVVME